MEITMLTLGGIVVASGYVAITLTTPTINEEGEEEYSLPGRILLGGTNAIKWVFDTVFGWVRYLFGGSANELSVEGKRDDDDEYEITV